MTTHKLWRYEHHKGLGTDLRTWTRTSLYTDARISAIHKSWYELAAYLSLKNLMMYDEWHPNRAMYIAWPVGQFPPAKLKLIPISEDDTR